MNLYSEIEQAIIRWEVDGHRTAGDLTRELLGIFRKWNMGDPEYMYRWITERSGRTFKTENDEINDKES